MDSLTTEMMASGTKGVRQQWRPLFIEYKSCEGLKGSVLKTVISQIKKQKDVLKVTRIVTTAEYNFVDQKDIFQRVQNSKEILTFD